MAPEFGTHALVQALGQRLGEAVASAFSRIAL